MASSCCSLLVESRATRNNVHKSTALQNALKVFITFLKGFKAHLLVVSL